MTNRWVCWTARWLGVWMLVTANAQAGERSLVLKNWIERDWPRTLLHYDLAFKPGEFREGKLQLLGPDATPLEHQLVVVSTHKDGSIDRARLSFYSALPKGGSLEYKLVSADKPQGFSPRVTAKAKGKMLEVVSEAAGVRLPPPGETTFKTPVEPKDVPAPILGWRLSTGQWVGKSWLESDRKIGGWSQSVVADGPLYKEYAYEVRFVPEGTYKVRVRVEAELPLVHVAEEYDMGAATAGKDFFVMVLNDGWKPDTAFYAADRPSGETLQRIRDRRVEHDSQVWREPLDFSKDREHSRLYPGGDWGAKDQWYGMFVDSAEGGASGGDAASPFVGIMTEHTGAWRLPDQSLSSFWWMKDSAVLAKMRISIHLNGIPQNPFSTAEMDPSLPQTMGRRLWSLVLGPRPPTKAVKIQKDGKEQELQVLNPDTMDHYRSYHGFITLNDYKDWMLTWELKQDLPRPRAAATPESLARLKAALDRCPGRDVIKDTYLISGDPARALAEADRAIRSLDSRLGQALPYYMAHYRQTQFDYDPVFAADSALACKELPADVREKLCAKIAATCYMLTTADFCPRGAGTHMGNPNMAINRYMGMPLYAVMIQDHPMARTWLDDAAVYTKWKASYNVTSAGGTFRENPGYATYGPTIFLTTAAIALRNAGYDLDKWEPLKDIGRYFTDIETPFTAPRGMYRKDHIEWLAGRKVRVLPGFGNGSDVAGAQTQMLLANLTAKSDPAFAPAMMTGWQEGGAYFGTEQVYPGFWFYWSPDIQPAPVRRGDRMITGFGGVLRAHSDTAGEIYACLRQGYTQSHWNPDQGTFVLYARGACLCPPTGWGYSGTAGICHDSRICFGEPLADHEHGRVDTNIEDYGSPKSVGYLLGRQTFKQRWDKSKTLKSDFDWSRQVLLLRSAQVAGANYVVVRDSTQASAGSAQGSECPLPSWWYQWLVASSNDVKPTANGVHVDAAEGVKLDITFVEPANATVTAKGTKVQGFAEDYTQISVAQGPNQGYLAVFYPYKAGETPASKIEKVAEGLIKVTTPESEDYVFASVDKPVVFKNDTLEIDALAGAVRIFKDKVLLVNASGRAGRVGYRGVVAEGIGPFEHETTVAPARAEVVKAGRTLASLDAPSADLKPIAVDGSGKHEMPDITGSGLKGWIVVEGDPSSPGSDAASKVTFIATEGFGKMGFKDFYVKGEAPFVCVHQPGKVTLTAEGRRRIFQMPIPEDIVPAKLLPPKASLPEDFKLNWSVGGWINWPWAVEVKVDGIGMQGGWYDGLMTVGLDDGKHVAEIGPYTNPPVWPSNAYTRLLPVPAK